MKRIITMALVLALTVVFFYLSRFWYLRLWDREGLLGLRELRPQGGLVGQWLRGSDFAPFELIIWALGVFVVLSVAQKIYDMLNPPPEH